MNAASEELGSHRASVSVLKGSGEVGAGRKREKVGSLGMLFQIWPPKRFRPSEADLLEVGEGEKDLES